MCQRARLTLTPLTLLTLLTLPLTLTRSCSHSLCLATSLAVALALALFRSLPFCLSLRCKDASSHEAAEDDNQTAVRIGALRHPRSPVGRCTLGINKIMTSVFFDPVCSDYWHISAHQSAICH